MREEYIELIKKYIGDNPEYKSTLNELRTSVLAIGATEEEFDETIKQITGLPETSGLILKKNQKEAEKSEKSSDFIKHLKVRKKFAILAAFADWLIQTSASFAAT